MKKYTKMAVIYTALIIMAAVVANLVVLRAGLTDASGLYKVEINRIMNELENSGSFHKPNLSDYEYVTAVDFLPAEAEDSEIDVFYSFDNENTVIQPIYINDSLAGYVKFRYAPPSSGVIHTTLIMVNAVFVAMLAAIIGVFVYIRNRTLKPFEAVAEMPRQLARGQLLKPAHVEKSQYLAQFLWGLDVLRESLSVQKKRLQNIEREKKTLILSLSHDIKTPLSAIKLYIKALKDGLYDTPEKQRDIVASIEQKALAIEGYVKDLVRGTTEDMLSIEVCNSEFYLRDMIEQLQDNYKERLMLVNTKLIVGEFQNIIIYGDIDRALEALENVIENALKYGDGKPVYVDFAREENCQLLTVSNTGSTLPHDEALHIFDSFWRGSNAEGQPGSGLGLYIARQIMHKINGDVYANVEGDIMRVTFVFNII